MEIELRTNASINTDAILDLYEANNVSSVEIPTELILALKNSHTLIQAFHKEQLIGLGNAISDGYLVVYYPHLVVHPDFQGEGIGQKIMTEMTNIYEGFYQQIVLADKRATDFYKKCGFEKAGNTESMWIYTGEEY